MTQGTANPWLTRRVIAYAHQCGAWEAPSSTVFALERALAAGVTGIELDVHSTADRHLVVCHDGTVDRTTDRSGAISTLTLAQLRRLDNAYWFVPGADVTPGLDPSAYPYRGRAPGDPSFSVATLDDVLDVLDAHRGVALNLDIKQTAPAVEPYEDLLADCLARHPAMSGRVIVASFLDTATDAFSALAPDVATSSGIVHSATWIRALQAGDELPESRQLALQLPERQGDLVIVDERLVEAAHRVGYAVHVWTVNDGADMSRLVDLGVDGIISDLPTMLVGLIDGRGMRATI
ncbi:MAG: glycerophosphodiester phosphodiesterase [Acidimicrobiales bacterium]